MGAGALTIVAILYGVAAVDAAKRKNFPLCCLFLCWAAGAVVSVWALRGER